MEDKSFNNELHQKNGGLWSAVFQGMAFVGPAATAASFFVVEAAVVGPSVPLTYMIAIIGVAAAMYMNYRFFAENKPCRRILCICRSWAWAADGGIFWMVISI